MPKPPLHDIIVKPARPREGYDQAAPVRPRSQAFGNDPRRARPEYAEASSVPPHAHEAYESTFEPHHARPVRGEKRFPWLPVALGIGAVILISSFVLSLAFAGATVTVYPKQETVSVSTDFTTNFKSGSLPFDRMSLERTTETALVALREEEVEERASGRITIFNAYSETPQRLIKNTRFESPDGLIYRIRESVEVPGMKGANAPGQVEVAVFAEEPGEKYNKASTEFTIPGFEGLPQEGKVYARSVGDLTGGFAGKRRTVEESERKAALATMETKLRDDLLAAAFTDTAKPENYVLYKDAVFFEFEEQPQRLEGEDKVVLTLRGVLHGILLEEDALARSIAGATIGGYEGTPVYIDNPDDIRVTLSAVPDTEGSTGEDTQKPWLAEALTASVSGKARLVWQYDEVQLAQDLAGRDKEAMYTVGEGGILAGYPGIDRAEASVRPFWKGAFPEDPKDVTVVTVLDS